MSMEDLLEHILDSSDNGQAEVLLQFRSNLAGPVAGALRRYEKVEGIYEFLTLAQSGPNSKPFPLTHLFEASEVARVMAKGDETALPKIVAPPGAGGGLIIPGA
jgi:hypothetical protein